MTKEEWLNELTKRHGKELQHQFNNATIAICGLGGLGSNVAVSLARAGVGKLLLIDFDKVDISNLHRQNYTASQLGMYKTKALQVNLQSISPYCDIETFTETITEENCFELLKNADIICECFDNPDSKAMLIDTISTQLSDKYIIASSGMSGLHSCNTIHTKKLTKRIYICGDGESDVANDGTLFAPRVMLCAAHQATTALRIIAGNYDV